jgi:hypothetical protein
MQISTELILTREFQYVTSLTAHFGAVTMTNINKMSALTYEHHTYISDQQHYAKNSSHCTYKYHGKQKKKLSFD